MTKFNTPAKAKAVGKGYITSEATASTTTFEGASAFVRDEKSELFLLAVSNFVGEGSFYEAAGNRDSRFASLSGAVAVADLEWTIRFVYWLRHEANMRSAPLVVALEGAHALKVAGIPGGRALVAAALHRADEPGEALAYWFSRFGRKIPMSVKRGIGDAVTKSYNERSLGKYDASGKGFRFGDVIDLVHPTPKDARQSDLFKYALDRRRDSKTAVPESLTTLQARAEILATPGADLRAQLEKSPSSFSLMIQDAGITWEVLSGILPGGMDAKAWESVIPSLGYMALLRNLRNFEEAGVSGKVLDAIAARISDPEEVAKSRQLPLRFLSAFRATGSSLRFKFPLEKALGYSLANVPGLSGKTLILVDRSGSMFGTYSQRSDLDYADTAAVFGTALALRAENATLVQFGSGHEVVNFMKSDSVLGLLPKFKSMGGTSTEAAVRAHYAGHDRVIILTDEQAHGGWGYSGDPSKAVPADVPLFNFNLVGYQQGTKSGANRYHFGGLNDASFGLIDLITRGRDSDWPF